MLNITNYLVSIIDKSILISFIDPSKKYLSAGYGHRHNDFILLQPIYLMPSKNRKTVIFERN